VTTETNDKVDALIRYDRHITSEERAAIDIGKTGVKAIIRELGYRKFVLGGCRTCLPLNKKPPTKHLRRTSPAQ
jgi:hypothetical protein